MSTIESATKTEILKLLRKWVNQRPGLDPRDYGGGRDGWLNYRQESAMITKQRQDALTLLRACELSAITTDELMQGFRAFSGRLELKRNEKGLYLDYCTGQYWPTEYRAAACAVLASALWEYYRPDYKDDDHAGDKLRAMFRRMFGKRMQEKWFD